MIGARAAIAALLAAVAVSAPAGGAVADDAPAESAPGARPATYPLVLLLQGDELIASEPAGPQDPRDAPPGLALRLRRALVGFDVAQSHFRARILFEADAVTASGSHDTPLAGGQMPFGGPVRATEAYVAWAPGRAFELDVGSLRVPFSLSRQVDEGDLRLAERAPFVDAFLPDFRTGVGVGGDLGALLYRAAFLSADTTFDGRLISGGLLGAARIWAEPIGPVGLAPWRRTPNDPWYDWFRFAGGVSVLYGTVAAPRTLAIDPDFQAQWRRFVVTAEYLFAIRYDQNNATLPGSVQQGAVIEPGVTFYRQRLDLVARADWERVAGADLWGAGGGVTAYAPDPRWRLSLGFEQRWGESVVPGASGSSHWVILRLTLAVD